MPEEKKETVKAPYAVVETGGKQYRVKAGDVLEVELVHAEAGATVKLSPVLALSDGATLRVGTPHIADTVVSCEVLRNTRGDKVVSFKKKRRKGYSRTKGHRQHLTVLKVQSIG